MNVNESLYRKKGTVAGDMPRARGASKKKRRVKKERRRQKAINIMIVVLACLAVLVGGGKVIYNYYQDTAKILQPVESEDSVVDWENKIAQNFDKNIINFALLGFDKSASREDDYGEGSYRPDTIMVLSINFKSEEMSIVSIPRDTYVDIHGRQGRDKINHAYMYGYRQSEEDPHLSGIKTTVRTIQDFLGGIPVHYYVVLDMDVAEEVVDIIGGIEYDVDVAVRSHAGRGPVVVEKGPQTLDGRKFMYYVRFRADSKGDLGRIDRQQDIMIAAFEQLREKGKLTQIPDIYRSVQKNVDTNLSLSQMGALALYGMEVDPSDIDNYRFDGEGQYTPRGGQNIYYLVPNEQQRVDIIEEVFGQRVDKRPQINLPPPIPDEEEEEEETESEPEEEEEETGGDPEDKEDEEEKDEDGEQEDDEDKKENGEDEDEDKEEDGGEEDGKPENDVEDNGEGEDGDSEEESED